MRPDIVARAIVNVSASAVAISRADASGVIELSNTGQRDADLSQWMLRQSATPPRSPSFVIPDGTTLLPGKAVIFPPVVTGFSAGTMPFVPALLLPSGEVVAVYTPPIVIAPAPVPAPEPQHKEVEVQKIESTTLTASALPPISPQNENALMPAAHKNIGAPIVFGILALLAGAGVLWRSFYLWKKSAGTESEDSIRIVEEE